MENFVDAESKFSSHLTKREQQQERTCEQAKNIFKDVHYKGKNLAKCTCSFNLFLWKALTEAMANIKLDKNVVVSFRFTVADESRLLVVLQFYVFFRREVFL